MEKLNNESKYCSRCKIVKSTSEFCKYAKGKDGLQVWCTRCISEYRKDYYNKYPEKQKERSKKYQEKHRDYLRIKGKEYRSRNRGRCRDWAVEYREKAYVIVNELKINGCSICGYNESPYALEFHHVNPEDKNYNITYTTITRKDLATELSKCILLCANCHRIIHYGSDIDE